MVHNDSITPVFRVESWNLKGVADGKNYLYPVIQWYTIPLSQKYVLYLKETELLVCRFWNPLVFVLIFYLPLWKVSRAIVGNSY